jgi:hypothetical protein
MDERQERSAFALDAVGQRAKAAAKAAWWSAAGGLARAITRPTQGESARSFAPEGPPVSKARLRQSYLEAFEKDARDVAAGLYPAVEDAPSQPIKSLLRALDFLVDARAVDQRRRRGDGVEVRSEPETEAYPNYYRQNFHYQSGGWFTPRALAAMTPRWRPFSPARRARCVVGGSPCWPGAGADATIAS